MTKSNLVLIGLVVVALGLLIAPDWAECAVDPYKSQQPPFNGGIFGKRNSLGIQMDGPVNLRSWKTACTEAMEICTSLFLESN